MKFYGRRQACKTNESMASQYVSISIFNRTYKRADKRKDAVMEYSNLRHCHRQLCFKWVHELQGAKLFLNGFDEPTAMEGRWETMWIFVAASSRHHSEINTAIHPRNASGHLFNID